MKRKITFTVALLLLVVTANAQGTLLKEWLKQKKTQKEYLLNQIAALQVYIGYAKRGYEIYDKGLTFIGGLKDGEFNLHNDFFLSLKGINPEIGRYARVADIIALQVSTVRTCSKSLKVARNGGNFGSDEIAYLSGVFGRLLGDCAALVDELIVLTTSDKWELEDDERLRRIDQLHAEMQDRHDFARYFGNGVTQLDQSRARERRDIENTGILNNLKTD